MILEVILGVSILANIIGFFWLLSCGKHLAVLNRIIGAVLYMEAASTFGTDAVNTAITMKDMGQYERIEQIRKKVVDDIRKKYRVITRTDIGNDVFVVEL